MSLLTPFIVMLILSILGGSNNEKHTICPFMVLNGRATEALTFYQEAFAGDILFKITNQEFKERLNPSLTIPLAKNTGFLTRFYKWTLFNYN